jgi:hypothetical protein
MSVKTIFDRRDIIASTCRITGLINVVDIFKSPSININNISDIVYSFICSDTFVLIVDIACKICNLPPNEIVVYYTFSESSCRGWYLHPILIKSVLRHIDNLLNKSIIAQIVYESGHDVNFYKVMSSSLLFIVNNIVLPTRIDAQTEYKCKSILNKTDMFNDDHLIMEYIKHTITETLTFLPLCICDMIFSMVSI